MFHECAVCIFKQHALGYCWFKEHPFLATFSRSMIFRETVVFLKDVFLACFKGNIDTDDCVGWQNWSQLNHRMLVVLRVSLLFQRTLQIILQDIPACCYMKYHLKWEELSCTCSFKSFLSITSLSTFFSILSYCKSCLCKIKDTNN